MAESRTSSVAKSPHPRILSVDSIMAGSIYLIGTHLHKLQKSSRLTLSPDSLTCALTCSSRFVNAVVTKSKCFPKLQSLQNCGSMAKKECLRIECHLFHPLDCPNSFLPQKQLHDAHLLIVPSAHSNRLPAFAIVQPPYNEKNKDHKQRDPRSLLLLNRLLLHRRRVDSR